MELQFGLTAPKIGLKLLAEHCLVLLKLNLSLCVESLLFLADELLLLTLVVLELPGSFAFELVAVTLKLSVLVTALGAGFRFVLLLDPL